MPNEVTSKYTQTKKYLGDAVYIDKTTDPKEVVLTTENGISTTNRIYLSQEVLKNFKEYLKENGM